MALTRWDPFKETVSLREVMDRLFEESFVRPLGAAPTQRWAGTLPIDLYETDDSFVVKATLPGVKPEEIDIQVQNGVLTIKGETKAAEEVKEENYHVRERRYGAFSRSVGLSRDINADKAEAAFDNGVLTLTLPKAEEAKPKRLTVKAKK